MPDGFVTGTDVHLDVMRGAASVKHEVTGLRGVDPLAVADEGAGVAALPVVAVGVVQPRRVVDAGDEL